MDVHSENIVKREFECDEAKSACTLKPIKNQVGGGIINFSDSSSDSVFPLQEKKIVRKKRLDMHKSRSQIGGGTIKKRNSSQSYRRNKSGQVGGNKKMKSKKQIGGSKKASKATQKRFRKSQVGGRKSSKKTKKSRKFVSQCGGSKKKLKHKKQVGGSRINKKSSIKRK
jgi:hypothetical protein